MRANLVTRHRGGPAGVRRHRRLRGQRRPGDRERGARRARTSCSSASAARRRPASPGCSSRCSTSGCRSSAAASSTTTRSRRSAPRPGRSSRRAATITPIDWLPRDRRYAEKLATPDITIADLIGEVDPIRVAEGRYLSDELTLHYGLIPRANRGHLRDQRAARPRGADPGRPAQHPRGARRPGPRLHDPAAARPVRRRVGQPGGLHEPRPDHHAAQGPARVADPDALPAQPRARGRDRAPGEAALPGRTSRSRPWSCRGSWRSWSRS